MDMERSSRYSFEMGPIRPPSEGKDRSLLIRATRNCPWNRCEFCNTYKGKRFEYRNVEEIERDIDAAKTIADMVKANSWSLGYGGRIINQMAGVTMHGAPEIYGRDVVPPEEWTARVQCLMTAVNWLGSGAKTIFLQDADTLIMRTMELVEVIRYLRQTFPSVERVTSYARAKTASRKSPEELKELHRAGLSRLHMGLESGCDEVLLDMQKGVTAEQHANGGRKVVESGISLSEYVMPGLGGRRWSTKHALETAGVLNQINPDFIRLRSLIVRRGSPLYQKLEAGEFEPLPEDEVVDEIGLLIENLDCTSYLASDQMSNLLLEVEGRLPEEKEAMLRTIEAYRAMLPLERLAFRLRRRTHSYLGVYGAMDAGLTEKVETAHQAIESGSPDAPLIVNSAIAALKQGFV